MRLSIVVIFHNMTREAFRTLYSLSPAYQTGLVSEDYEVIAIDNGSAQPLDGDWVQSLGPQFSCHMFETLSASPVEAVNAGARMATGDLLAVIVDGARMASPGLIGQTQRAAALYEEPFVATLSWHLGPDVQNRSVLSGYGQAEEDRLLDSIAWPDNGYALFSISTLAQSSQPGFLGGIPIECSWFTMRRDAFLRIGGFDRRFQSPGGGLVNHDFRDRALCLDDVMPVVLLGEGMFHQFHGGVATNVAPDDHPIHEFRAEYDQIHGRHYRQIPSPAVVYFGTLPEAARRFLGSESG